MEEVGKVLEIIRNSESQEGGFGGANIYSEEYRHDYDNDSSTDEEDGGDDLSSDDEQDFTSRYGKIATQTSRTGKVRIKTTEDEGIEEMEEDAEDTDDDFEADMERELAGRMLEAEKNAAIANTCPLPHGVGEDGLDMESTSAKGNNEAFKDGKYSDIYFDSDEEESENRKVVTNDDLFYDPDKDDDDQDWVDSVRQSYQQAGPGQAATKLPNSDAVLNCPACFTVLCMDCQRHEVYNTQYRAMFVVNCTVNIEQKLKFPVKGKGSGKGKRGKKNVVTDPNSEYHPVMCDNCKTEVAMYDQEEVYHFFNVVASHS
eukprot:GFUD01018949.1.p1 GENE.GFUD01018949.1~~GFUD01018949.1.p1  ORF type:complete len:332 (+),score=120.64 GFUD01018949.1:52-996(+)